MGDDTGRSRGTFPPVMRRAIRWWIGLSVGFSMLAIAWVALRGWVGLPRHGWFRFVPLMFGLVPLLIVTPVWIIRTRWIRRDLLASDGRLCTHCAYNVSALPGSGTCPECGGAYDVELDKDLWRAVGARYGDEE